MKRSKVLVFCGVLCLLALGAYGVLHGWIQWDAHRKGQAAWKANPQAESQADALLMVVQSDFESMEQRNMAVWTLGRLRAESALVTLEGYYTDTACDHENQLCRRELKKAICRCGGQI